MAQTLNSIDKRIKRSARVLNGMEALKAVREREREKIFIVEIIYMKRVEHSGGIHRVFMFYFYYAALFVFHVRVAENQRESTLIYDLQTPQNKVLH